MRSTFFLLLLAHLSFGQPDLPELSPISTIEQKVGYTRFMLRYGRPAARKRKIMGELVPYQTLWRTGAGKCSTISFDSPVSIDNKIVPAGIYTIVTIPGQREWTVMLNSDTSKVYGHPSEYDVATEAVRFKTRPEKTGRFYESMTFDLDVVRNDAILYLSWENIQISFRIATGAHERAIANIRDAIAKNPDDPELLARASFYYSMNNENPGQVLRWLDHAIAHGGDRWVYHQKVDMLARLGRYADARTAAAAGIEFLRRTKPQEWQDETQIYENKIKQWASK